MACTSFPTATKQTKADDSFTDFYYTIYSLGYERNIKIIKIGRIIDHFDGIIEMSIQNVNLLGVVLSH